MQALYGVNECLVDAGKAVMGVASFGVKMGRRLDRGDWRRGSGCCWDRGISMPGIHVFNLAATAIDHNPAAKILRRNAIAESAKVKYLVKMGVSM